jgi:D-amino peptidase
LRVYLMTDMEGVSGVTNFEDFIKPEGRYYERGRQLTTGEVSAAVEGALNAGATDVLVVDGHGAGAIDPLLLHPAARLLTRGRYPFGLDLGFDCAGIIGQHAKASTPDGHLCHTQTLEWLDCTINGVSVGEMGEMMLLAAEYDVPTVALSGDAAACREAQALVPGIATAAVKQGLSRSAAIHLHPQVAQGLIRDAVQQGIACRAEMPLFRLAPPFEMVVTWQTGSDGPVKRGRKTAGAILEVLTKPYDQIEEVPQ